MTDIMKLADYYACCATLNVDDARAALQSAIEALQAEIEQVKGFWKEAQLRNRNLLEERDALQAKLDALEKQEPTAYTTAEELEFLEKHERTSATMFNFTEPDQKFISLYASPVVQQAPKALESLTQTQVVEAFCNTPHNVQYVSVFDAGVRFAEKHHGITKGTPT